MPRKKPTRKDNRYEFKITLGRDIHGNIQRMENAFDMFPTRLNACEQALANLHIQIENAKAEVEKPFMQEDELKTKENINLIYAVKITLYNSLNLIGVIPKERM